jgi:hypothetical protein
MYFLYHERLRKSIPEFFGSAVFLTASLKPHIFKNEEDLMIVGNDMRDITFSTMMRDLRDKGFIRGVAQGCDAETLKYFIEKAVAWGRQDLANFLKKESKREAKRVERESKREAKRVEKESKRKAERVESEI